MAKWSTAAWGEDPRKEENAMKNESYFTFAE